jgi:Heterokaryon incompatibility protein (HET)
MLCHLITQRPDELAACVRKVSEMPNDSTGSDAACEVASFWLRNCLTSHPNCPKPGSFLPSRVIDVGPEDGSEDPYVRDTRKYTVPSNKKLYATLSHCWGNSPMITTTRATLLERSNGIPISTLPKTFRDAVIICRKLGVRYLWIDSLCIVQDDSDDWEHESAHMCDIYQQTYFTICAAHASDSSMGCLVQREGLLYNPFEISFPVSRQGSTGPLNLQFHPFSSNQNSKNPGPPLFSRAWVLQEQVLSPRMLIYESDLLHWECFSMSATERSLNSFSRDRSDLFDSTRKELRRRITNQEKDPWYSSLDEHLDWCMTVMEFTHRGMTKSTDRLSAIAGIAGAIQAQSQDKYIAGLWRNHLWRGLLWSIPFNTELTTTTDLTVPDTSRHERSVAPSWTWASISSPVVYPVPTISLPGLHSVCEILDVEVDGGAARQTGKIIIRGDVRTMYVDSRYSILVAQDLSNTLTRKPGTRNVDLPSESYFRASSHQCLNASGFSNYPGIWRPDEIVSPDEPITFIAIAQRQNHARSYRIDDKDPMSVYALGLRATGRAEKEYRRVGLALWTDCAWYGFDCREESKILLKSGSGFGQTLQRIAKKGIDKAKTWLRSSLEKSNIISTLGQQKTKPVACPALALADGTHKHPISMDESVRREAYCQEVEVENVALTII